MARKILIVEDDQALVGLLKAILEQEGFQVIAASDGMKGLQAATTEKPDLAIVDLTVPQLDGFDLCRRLRREVDTANIPILILSGKQEEIDKVVAFELGADDYVTKPFKQRELVVRIHRLLRRASPQLQPKVLRAGHLEVDLDRYTVRVAGKSVILTSKEFELIRTLLDAKGRVLTRESLLEKIWGEQVPKASRTIDVHIRSLRKKLGSEGRRILTVRNVGYRFENSSAD
jgi:DNA-binding response OmpR family regulator